MSGDFSRDRSRTAHMERYTQVLAQQGRALLDAELNEQSAIHHDFLRMFIADSVGRGWRPALGTGGFDIETVIPPDPKNFKITKGHFYVDGILCDNPIDCTYLEQPHQLLPRPLPLGNANFIAYIECWERHLCAVQRPELREIALGGPDTAARAQIVWQVRAATADWVTLQADQVKGALAARLSSEVGVDEKLSLNKLKKTLTDSTNDLLTLIGSIGTALPPKEPEVRANLQAWFDAMTAAPPRLRAMAKRDASDNEACSISPDSIYRGRENQFYRVEIHDGGSLAAGDKPTFKWSRENGSVLFAVRVGESIKVSADLVTIPVETLGHDRRTGLCVGDWVELSSEAFELDSLAPPPPLGQVKQIDRTSRMVEVQIYDKVARPDFSICTLLRRWDQMEHLDTKGAVAITEASGTNVDTWTPLEHGVKIQFQPGGVYRTRDHWHFPARVSRDVLWPQGKTGPEFMAPNGIQRHWAAIGQGPI